MNSIVVAVFVSCLALASCTDFTDCGSKEANIVSIDIPGCTKGPCIFKKGTDVHFNMTFTANQYIDAATTEITAYLGAIPLAFHPSDPKACDFMECPIKKGDTVIYSQKFDIKESTPSVTAMVQWKLVDTNTNDAITCFRVEAKIE